MVLVVAVKIINLIGSGVPEQLYRFRRTHAAARQLSLMHDSTGNDPRANVQMSILALI
jgi:hypothetical protein